MEEYRAYWKPALDRLEAYLKTVTTENKPAGSEEYKKHHIREEDYYG
ncbi:MAG: hypothetical protein U0103_10945 [Candidatus Obscuribacterales bacterium]